ncbi:hypothetical protein M407DRAFT_227367 [Tulasnella calospora MUT 4182]|uniref:Uncharacterized protein n=1 Tax=Tulasnella calospora MUT 4182 TaxID=1051891 RepID=A0A0C3QQ38_9AGAM|nr:hypothetical protein M407DRAFT_227367 [Tulasnella calospora MUT 4182]
MTQSPPSSKHLPTVRSTIRGAQKKSDVIISQALHHLGVMRQPQVPTPVLVMEKALPPLPHEIPQPSPLAAGTDEGWTTVNLRPDIRLPAELWKLVFEHATNTYPYPLSSHHFSPRHSISQPSITEPDDERRLIRASMEIKRTISLVCRAWRTVGMEFLFHTIHVTSQRTIPSLWYALREDANRQPDSGQGSDTLTWWIRRIWVEDLGPLSWFILVSEKLPEYSVLELVRRCPKLVEFAGPGLSKPLRKLDFSPFQPALHAICNSDISAASPLTTNGGQRRDPPRGLSLSFRIADADEMNRFVTANPSLASGFGLLRSLYLHCGGTSGQAAVDTSPVRLPSLQFLSVRGQYALEQAFTFVVPSLTSLQYIRNHANDPIEPLLTAIGMDLEELDLIGSTAFADGYIERTCPRLRVLHISTLDHFESNLSEVYHSGITTVGVFQMYLGDEVTRAGMSARIQRLQWAFPSLSLLRDTSWKEQALRQRAAVSGRFPDRKYCGYWMCLADVAKNAEVRLVDWRERDIGGFFNTERCRIEWDPVLERMLTAATEVVEEDGQESS